MKRYYLCDTHIGFATRCDAVVVKDNDDLVKVALQWGKDNGVTNVFIYDNNKQFIWTTGF